MMPDKYLRLMFIRLYRRRNRAFRSMSLIENVKHFEMPAPRLPVKTIATSVILVALILGGSIALAT